MMYKKYGMVLFLAMCIIGCCMFNVTTIKVNRVLANELFQKTMSDTIYMKHDEISLSINYSFMEAMNKISSARPIVDYNVLVSDTDMISDEEYTILCRIVEAEAGGEDYTGKVLVANVVLNRVESDKFPNSVKEVVFQKTGGITQFSPISDGRYFRVEVSEETENAVNAALAGEDKSQGALYFVNRSHADLDNLKWFDSKCNLLFTYGGHEFFS